MTSYFDQRDTNSAIHDAKNAKNLAGLYSSLKVIAKIADKRDGYSPQIADFDFDSLPLFSTRVLVKQQSYNPRVISYDDQFAIVLYSRHDYNTDSSVTVVELTSRDDIETKS